MPTPKHHIWINGFPGVGKLTTAKELHRQIPNSVLIHNHELIDVVTLPRDHPDYISERTMVREETFARWCQPTGPDAEEILDRVLIFTDFFSQCDLGSTWANQGKDAAAKGGRPFFPVYLTCEREEQLRRVESPQRQQGGKLTDRATVHNFLDKLELFRWPDQGLELDVTTMKPEETATKIIDALHIG